jgi:hypothetical protein
MAAALNALGAARVQPKPRVSRKAGPRLAVVPSREFHPVQEIDNSRVRRVADPREIRNLLFYLAIGACVFASVLLFSWQQFAIVKDGYEIADLKARRDALIEDNKILGVRVEALHTPERLSNVAVATLGLTQPKQGQVIHLDNPLPAVEGEPVVASLHPYVKH